MIIYKTKETPGHSSQKSYWWNEYRLEGGRVVKYRCYRFKFFDGRENIWEREDKEEESWDVNSPSLPEWLKRYL